MSCVHQLQAVSVSLNHWQGNRTVSATCLARSTAVTAQHYSRSVQERLPTASSLICQAQRGYGSSEDNSQARAQWTPRQASSSYSPSPSQLLNSTIERSSSPTGLSNILQQHRASLDPVHLCMMMTKLLRLAPRKRDHPPSHTSIPSAQLQPSHHDHATAEPSSSTPTQTEVIHTLAVDIASAAVEFLHRLTPRHCSTLLSGLSQCSPSQLHPPAWLVESLTTRAVERAASASVHDLVQLLHAVTNLRARPTLPQLTIILIQLLQHAQLQRQGQVPRVGPQDVSMTLWSLATLQQHPGRIWMDAFLLCSAPQLPGFRPQVCVPV